MRKGFTLFEVAVSLALVAIGVLTLAGFLPSAIKVQEQARFQVYAATKALDIVEVLSATSPNLGDAHVEADLPWDVPTGYAVTAPDIEHQLATIRNGILPLPLDIARRLDSRDGLIREVLDAGGHLYYANPNASIAMKNEAGLAIRPPAESRRLVFAVLGAAQQNALLTLPWKSWPYYGQYPAGPSHGLLKPGSLTDSNAPPWEGRIDPDLRSVWQTELGDHDGNYTAGYLDYARMDMDGDPGWLLCRYYVALALWYAAKKGLPSAFLNGVASDADIAASYTDPERVRAMRILAHAATCLTKWHALDEQPALGTESVALFQSEWRASRNPPDTTTKTMIAMPARAGLRIGVPIPGRDEATTAVPGRTGPGPANMADFLSAAGLALPAPLASLPLPPYPSGDPWYQPGNVYITHDMIVNYHETSLKMIMRHAAENPYDWSSPRPMNRMLMTDFPLMQWDVIDNPSRSFDTAGGSPSSPRQRLTGTITGTVGDPNIGRITAQQWRPIAADDITNFGPNAYGTVHDWDQLKGEISHFSLTAAFDPAERCRELVFWSVDWTAFEDVETARSAPVDASRYPKTAPHLVPLATESGTAWERSFTLGLMGQPYQHRNYPYLRFEDISQPAFRNPEKRLLYITSVADRGTSDGIRHITIGLDDRGHTEQWRGYEAYTNESNNGADAPDAYFSHPKPVYGGAEAIPRSDPKAVFSGLFGADRDADGVLDRGPLPASTRMRAVEVARYTIYDPRLHLRLK